MTPATTRGKRGSFADAPPPRDAELLRHEIASALQAAGRPLHQMEIQAKVRVRVPLWEILQALHLGPQHFAPAGPGTWELREAGVALAALPLPVTDEVVATRPAPSRSSKTRRRDDGDTAEAKPASSRSRQAASRADDKGGKAKTTPAAAARGDELPWDVSETPSAGSAARKPRAPVVRAVEERPGGNGAAPARAATPPVRHAETPRPVPQAPPVPWSELPAVVDVLRLHGHPMPAHDVKRAVLAAGGTADFDGLLALANASPDLLRYPYGRGLYLGLPEWGGQAWEEVAESLWAQARVQLLGSELFDLDAVRAMLTLAQRRGDTQVQTIAQRLLG